MVEKFTCHKRTTKLLLQIVADDDNNMQVSATLIFFDWLSNEMRKTIEKTAHILLSYAAFIFPQLPKGSEPFTEIFNKKFGLFKGCEVTPLAMFFVIDQVGI
jgi:hypothetical protein